MAFDVHWINRETGHTGVTRMHMKPDEDSDALRARFRKLFPAVNISKVKVVRRELA